MIEDRGHGVKRKLSDVDGDLQTRCYQRQTIFNISVCKLRKNYCSGEPLLSKTVLIANTIRMIEEDMAEEREQIAPFSTSTSSNENLGARIEHDGRNLFAQRTSDSVSKPLDLMNFEEELNLLGDKIVRELGLDLSVRNCERKTRIATCSDVTDTNNNASNERTGESERENVSCSSLLGLELTDELEFGDIDLSLYDFDSCGATALPLEVEELCAAWGLAGTLTTRCSNSFKKERTVTEDDLDQVMQILVGS